jgi:hypothetical protein
VVADSAAGVPGTAVVVVVASGPVGAGVVAGVVTGVGAGVVVVVGAGVVVGVVVGAVGGSVVVVVSTGGSCAATGPDVSVAARIAAATIAARRPLVPRPPARIEAHGAAMRALRGRRWVMRSIRFGSWRETRWR